MVYLRNQSVCLKLIWLSIIANLFTVSKKLIPSKKIFTNLEQSLVEDISVLLPVLPQDNLAEVRVVDQSVNVDLIGHVDHLLLTRVQAEGFHGIKSVLREYKFGMEWMENL